MIFLKVLECLIVLAIPWFIAYVNIRYGGKDCEPSEKCEECPFPCNKRKQ